MKQITFTILKIVMLFSLVACSEEDSEKVDATFIPSNPDVRFYDSSVFLYTDPETQLAVTEPIIGPWFRFKIKVTNGSSKTVIVSNLDLKLTSVSATQGVVNFETDFSSADLVENKQANAPGDPLASQVILVVPPAGSGESTYFYVTELPTSVTTGVFNVEVTASGWFGTLEAPTDKFQQKYFFTTD